MALHFDRCRNPRCPSKLYTPALIVHRRVVGACVWWMIECAMCGRRTRPWLNIELAAVAWNQCGPAGFETEIHAHDAKRRN